MSLLTPRPYARETAERLAAQGLHPVLARAAAARGIGDRSELAHALAGLLPYARLRGVREMAQILAEAIAARQRLLVVADYDSDGATACALAVRALREFGADVDYVVPNRFEYGYGLTPEIVEWAAHKRPDIIVTVDNGIASVAGVEAANAKGIQVLVTDHHLPGPSLPSAAAIVNPNQPGCEFPSKHLAGVGVIFYVMAALRATLRDRGVFPAGREPNLARHLDLVALGTIADVVRLDANNRTLVHQGLARIRAGLACPGIQALLAVAGRQARKASTADLGFALGPRLNAAGRLEDMSLGIECLITDDPERATALAQRLDELNRDRRAIEHTMQDEAQLRLDAVDVAARASLSLFDPGWHPGVIGILAARVKDRHHRPVIAFAPGGSMELKGSGRSIPAFHLRDALDWIAKQHPDLILKFGGHAMAAGLTIRQQDFARFGEAFEAVAQQWLSPADLERVIPTDGSLAVDDANLDLAELLEPLVWGQGFPPTCFQDCFTVATQRIVGGQHRKLVLERQGRSFDAIAFFTLEPLPAAVQAAYRLAVNEYRGARSLQLVLEHWEPEAERGAGAQGVMA